MSYSQQSKPDRCPICEDNIVGIDRLPSGLWECLDCGAPFSAADYEQSKYERNKEGAE
jgi:ribosomal protein L37AE/L43A